MQGRVLQRWRSSASGFGVDGLSEGEVEVMHLREENEALMDSLVRTKVDLAETEGEHLQHLPCSCCLLKFGTMDLQLSMAWLLWNVAPICDNDT